MTCEYIVMRKDELEIFNCRHAVVGLLTLSQPCLPLAYIVASIHLTQGEFGRVMCESCVKSLKANLYFVILFSYR